MREPAASVMGTGQVRLREGAHVDDSPTTPHIQNVGIHLKIEPIRHLERSTREDRARKNVERGCVGK